MARMKKEFILVALTLFLAGCCNCNQNTAIDETRGLYITPSAMDTNMVATAESLWLLPIATPDFILKLIPLPPQTISGEEDLCVKLYQPAKWWEVDDVFWRDYLKFHTTLVIDGEIISHIRDRGEVYTFGEYAMTFYRSAPIEGEYIGTYNVCIPLNITTGLHMATIEIVTPDGRGLSYSWSFRIEN